MLETLVVAAIGLCAALYVVWTLCPARARVRVLGWLDARMIAADRDERAAAAAGHARQRPATLRGARAWLHRHVTAPLLARALRAGGGCGTCAGAAGTSTRIGGTNRR